MRSRILAIVWAVILFSNAIHSTARETVDLVDLVPTTGPCHAVVGIGSIMYAGTGGYLTSTDVSEPSAPVLLAVEWFGVQVWDVTVVPLPGSEFISTSPPTF